MKPLYLNGNTVESIRLEHETLRIVSRQYSDTWLPLNRVSRIILSGDIALSTPVLSACLSNSIAITVTGKQGEFVGICFGTNYKDQSLQSHLAELQDSPNRQFILDNWFSAQQRKSVLRIQKKFHLPRELLAPAEVKAKLSEQISLSYSFYDWQTCLTKIIPMLAAQLTMLLKSFGLRSEVLRPAPSDIGLLQRFINLLEWELWQAAANGNLPSGTLRNQLIHYYQSHSSKVERLTRFSIDQLWHRFYEVEHEQN
jgi:hypothetical protein